MSGKQPFQSVGKVSPIRRTALDLSHDYKTTINMGKLYPVMCIDVEPGASFKIYNEIVLRFQPMIAPILHQVDVYTHTFFVPYRLLWGSVDSLEQNPGEPTKAWENFASGGKNNAFSVPIPRWAPPAGYNAKKTLWDYFGYPMEDNGLLPTYITRDGFTPVDFPRRAYNFIFNEYYRDQDLYPAGQIAADPTINKVSWTNDQILNRCWEKDYFTIARPTRQRGQALAVPLSGQARVNFLQGPDITQGTRLLSAVASGASTSAGISLTANVPSANPTLAGILGANMVDGVGTFDAADLRNLFQLQKWQERNARAGIRYKELIPAHFGVQIGDSRIDRPEYIGGTRSPVIVSEVLQTGGTNSSSPQGNMAGHALTADTTRTGSYFVKEFGLIMTLISVRPRTAYTGRQLNRQWLRRTRYDYYWPEFAHLAEQGVYQGEVSRCQLKNAWSVFGFQGVYDEYRYLPSYTTGDMRYMLEYWHLSRKIPDDAPLNWDFVKCAPRVDIFAVQQAPDPVTGTMMGVDNLILNYSSRIKAIRPLPFIAEPGLLDHF